MRIVLARFSLSSMPLMFFCKPGLSTIITTLRSFSGSSYAAAVRLRTADLLFFIVVGYHGCKFWYPSTFEGSSRPPILIRCLYFSIFYDIETSVSFLILSSSFCYLFRTEFSSWLFLRYSIILIGWSWAWANKSSQGISHLTASSYFAWRERGLVLVG